MLQTNTGRLRFVSFQSVLTVTDEWQDIKKAVTRKENSKTNEKLTDSGKQNEIRSKLIFEQMPTS